MKGHKWWVSWKTVEVLWEQRGLRKQGKEVDLSKLRGSQVGRAQDLSGYVAGLQTLSGVENPGKPWIQSWAAPLPGPPRKQL